MLKATNKHPSASLNGKKFCVSLGAAFSLLQQSSAAELNSPTPDPKLAAVKPALLPTTNVSETITLSRDTLENILRAHAAKISVSSDSNLQAALQKQQQKFEQSLQEATKTSFSDYVQLGAVFVSLAAALAAAFTSRQTQKKQEAEAQKRLAARENYDDVFITRAIWRGLEQPPVFTDDLHIVLSDLFHDEQLDVVRREMGRSTDKLPFMCFDRDTHHIWSLVGKHYKSLFAAEIRAAEQDHNTECIHTDTIVITGAFDYWGATKCLKFCVHSLEDIVRTLENPLQLLSLLSNNKNKWVEALLHLESVLVVVLSDPYAPSAPVLNDNSRRHDGSKSILYSAIKSVYGAGLSDDGATPCAPKGFRTDKMHALYEQARRLAFHLFQSDHTDSADFIQSIQRYAQKRDEQQELLATFKQTVDSAFARCRLELPDKVPFLTQNLTAVSIKTHSLNDQLKKLLRILAGKESPIETVRPQVLAADHLELFDQTTKLLSSARLLASRLEKLDRNFPISIYAKSLDIDIPILFAEVFQVIQRTNSLAFGFTRNPNLKSGKVIQQCPLIGSVLTEEQEQQLEAILRNRVEVSRQPSVSTALASDKIKIPQFIAEEKAKSPFYTLAHVPRYKAQAKED